MFLWDKLRAASEPVLIYGIGNGAEKVLALCAEYGVAVCGVFASDDHATDKVFQGYPVLRCTDALRRWPEAPVLLAFGVYQADVLDRITAMAQTRPVYVPDLPLLGGPLLTPAYLDRVRDDVRAARALLWDETSRRVFDAMLEAKLTGQLAPHFRADTCRDQDMALLGLGSQERFLDLGAYDGDTIREFLDLTHGEYASIDAWEPDTHNFRKLKTFAAGLPRVTLYPWASWDRVETLTFSGKGGRNCAKKPDVPGRYIHLHQVQAQAVDATGRDFTYVKLDVEGAEAESLRGMAEMLRRCRPKLCVSAYHKTDDLFRLPLLLETLCPGYRMFLRRNRCLPAWEIQLYAVHD